MTPEYYLVAPSEKTFGGIKVTKETEFEEWNDDHTIHQILKNLVLTTECNKANEIGGIKSKEESKLITELPENTILIWGEDTGYIIPAYRMVRPEEALETIKKIIDITKPIEEGTKKSIEKEG